MKRNLPILLAFFLGLCIATCNAFGQGISEVLEAAEAATPGPTSQAPTHPAPASGIDKLIADENAAFEKGFALGVAASRGQEIQPDPSQPRIVLTAAQQADAKRNNLTPQQYINVYKQIDEIQAALKEQKKMLADYLARRNGQPALAAPQASTCTKCGPNCRCTPGNCQCRWPGECMGVPDSRIERSVVKPATVQPAIEETVWRPATSPVRISYVPRRRVSRSYPMYQASYSSNGSVGGTYSAGSVGGHTGYSYSSYPAYSSYPSSSYSSRAVTCYDAAGNPVACPL